MKNSYFPFPLGPTNLTGPGLRRRKPGTASQDDFPLFFLSSSTFSLLRTRFPCCGLFFRLFRRNRSERQVAGYLLLAVDLFFFRGSLGLASVVSSLFFRTAFRAPGMGERRPFILEYPSMRNSFILFVADEWTPLPSNLLFTLARHPKPDHELPRR